MGLVEFSYSSPSQAHYDNPSSIVAALPPGTPRALSLDISSSIQRISAARPCGHFRAEDLLDKLDKISR